VLILFNKKAQSIGGKIMAERQRNKAIENYYKNPNLCKNCSKIIEVVNNRKVSDIKRKKFCNQSCAAQFNNRKYKKRTKIDTLKEQKEYFINKYTKEQLFKECKTWQSARGIISKHARKVYKNSGKDNKCEVCGYDLHIDICHLKAVSDFDDNTPILEINNINNLKGLCKNHHLEYDNGLLKF